MSFGSTPVVSPITRWNGRWRARRWSTSAARSRLFGVMMTSGLRHGRSTWRRSTWKSCAGVVRLQTWMLSSARAAGTARGARSSARAPGPRSRAAEEHEPAQAVPLVFAGDDELVDDDLRAVHEVAELRFPDHEAVGVVEAVAVLEAEHAGLGERAVVDLEACRVRGRAVRERRVARAVLTCRRAPRGGG